MELDKEQIDKLIAERERELEEFIMRAQREIAHREGGIAALRALKENLENPESQEDGGKEDE